MWCLHIKHISQRGPISQHRLCMVVSMPAVCRNGTCMLVSATLSYLYVCGLGRLPLLQFSQRDMCSLSVRSNLTYKLCWSRSCITYAWLLLNRGYISWITWPLLSTSRCQGLRDLQVHTSPSSDKAGYPYPCLFTSFMYSLSERSSILYLSMW